MIPRRRRPAAMAPSSSHQDEIEAYVASAFGTRSSSKIDGAPVRSFSANSSPSRISRSTSSRWPRRKLFADTVKTDRWDVPTAIGVNCDACPGNAVSATQCSSLVLIATGSARESGRQSELQLIRAC